MHNAVFYSSHSVLDFLIAINEKSLTSIKLEVKILTFTTLGAQTRRIIKRFYQNTFIQFQSLYSRLMFLKKHFENYLLWFSSEFLMRKELEAKYGTQLKIFVNILKIVKNPRLIIQDVSNRTC